MNEWGRVKRVLIGTATRAKLPRVNEHTRYVYYADRDADSVLPQGTYSQTIIDEANEDLDTLANIYKDFGAQVERPNMSWSSDRHHALYCPRDTILTVADQIITAPMCVNTRKDEWVNMLSPGNLGGNFPDHELAGAHLFDDSDYNPECVQNKKILALDNHKPMWDAANVLRAGHDILYLESNTGNLRGAKQLQDILGNDYKVHVLQDVYSYSHIDSTICLLRPGLALVNPARIKSKDDLPYAMQNWDILTCPEPVEKSWTDHCMSSIWTNMNLVSLDERTVVVDSIQEPTIQMFEAHGFTVIPINMRHQRTLDGGPHCCTIELDREYDLETYFDKT